MMPTTPTLLSYTATTGEGTGELQAYYMTKGQNMHTACALHQVALSLPGHAWCF